jgi:hypothetical protein
MVLQAAFAISTRLRAGRNAYCLDELLWRDIGARLLQDRIAQLRSPLSPQPPYLVVAPAEYAIFCFAYPDGCAPAHTCQRQFRCNERMLPQKLSDHLGDRRSFGLIQDAVTRIRPDDGFKAVLLPLPGRRRG